MILKFSMCTIFFIMLWKLYIYPKNRVRCKMLDISECCCNLLRWWSQAICQDLHVHSINEPLTTYLFVCHGVCWWSLTACLLVFDITQAVIKDIIVLHRWLSIKLQTQAKSSSIIVIKNTSLTSRLWLIYYVDLMLGNSLQCIFSL